MSQPPPPTTASSSRNRNMAILALVIGLIIGLASGIFLSVIFNLPTTIHTEASSQVQVSGTVRQTQNGVIKFTNLWGTISTSASITSGTYSISLVGGQSYRVYIFHLGFNYSSYEYSLYVPLGVTTFTGNF